jgi:hypothetical protein
MKFIVKEVKVRQDAYGDRRDKKRRCFVSFEDCSFMDWLFARRTFPHDKIRPHLGKILEEHGVTFKTTQWYQTCGCKCPCSPGFYLLDCKGCDHVFITLQLVDATVDELFNIYPISRKDEILAREAELYLGDHI